MTAMRNASKNAGELIDRPDPPDEPRPPGRDHAGDPGSRRRRRRADRYLTKAPTLPSLLQMSAHDRSQTAVMLFDSSCRAERNPQTSSAHRPASARRSPARPARELGELEAVRARGYWEHVWRRFRRDKVAIASGIFIILLVLVAFVGAPIAQHFIGHGPNDIFGTETGGGRADLSCCRRTRGRTSSTSRRRRTRGEPRHPRPRRGEPARPGRVPAPALRRAGLARGRRVLDDRRDVHRGHPRLDRRLLPRLGRHADLARHRDHDGLPGAALHRRARRDGRPAARLDHLRASSPRA